MPKLREPSLFDDQDEGQPFGADVPFGIALLALGCIEGLGQKGLQGLVGHFAEDLGGVFKMPLEAIEDLLTGCKIHGAKRIAQAVIEFSDRLVEQGEKQLKELEAKSIKLITPSRLPERLRALGTEAPKWLFVQGDEKLLHHHPAVAVVGTRKPTEEGCRAAFTVSYVLCSYPVLVISGLAEGIDAEVHATSLGAASKTWRSWAMGSTSCSPSKPLASEPRSSAKAGRSFRSSCPTRITRSGSSLNGIDFKRRSPIW